VDNFCGYSRRPVPTTVSAEPDCGTAENPGAGRISLLRTGSQAEDIRSVPSYGHSLNFAPHAPKYHIAIAAWANSIIR
jgi:hypothetical protein